MKTIMQLYQQHPYILSVVSTWMFNNVLSAFVGAFPAPTKESGIRYVWWFKFSNTVIGNIMRAKSTAIEKSPNWKDATQTQQNKPSA
jgi:hypothetical protein